ncbi:ATP-binding cassette domain-containing protein [Spiroplasma sp. TIUS-1]|uniref:ATP-binding cassette domain-containing protein n=1 Tax=Spiroplasma sp. TIUS-1 TaxID=216963 RepID=UPI0013A6A950|nr:ATP-binding cassette domain-containing protein [Spiroplasma sp. TIUS-1]
MAGWAVSLNGVAKVFGKDKWALKKINLKIMKNETVAIIGPRYSGKSILASIIGNQEFSTNGTIDYNFKESNLLKAIGYTQRSLEWPTGIKIKDIVNLYKTSFEMYDDEWMSRLYEVFDIEKSLNQKVNNSDKTFLKMFSLFLTFIPKPELVVIDEITQVVSMDNKERVLNFMKEYKEEYGVSYLIVNPDDFTFDFLCNRLIVMSKGFIVREHENNDNFVYSSYSLDIINRIKQKSIKPLTPDPVFKPIIERFVSKYNILSEQRSKFRERMSKFILTQEVESLNQSLSKMSLDVKNFHKNLIDYSENFISKSEMITLANQIQNIEKKHKKYLKEYKKIHLESEFKKVYSRYNPWLAEFVRFLRLELFPMLELKVVYQEDEKSLSMTTLEKNELKRMKKKLIKKELREIKKAVRSK